MTGIYATARLGRLTDVLCRERRWLALYVAVTVTAGGPLLRIAKEPTNRALAEAAVAQRETLQRQSEY